MFGAGNIEGEKIMGIILNAGGYTHTSIAIRDAVACAEVPVVEVHISDISKREEFRHISLLTDVCAHSIIGHGTNGYLEAVEWIMDLLDVSKRL
jgi:3-dehydroquinate dehydratase-2